MEKLTYKFRFETTNLDTADMQKKGWGRNYYLKNELFASYDMDYSIEKRKKTKLFVEGFGKAKRYYKEEVEVDWRETIYNVKVTIPKGMRWYIVTFKVKLTPKEAYLIGKSLEEGTLKQHFYNVSYKKVVKGEHGS